MVKKAFCSSIEKKDRLVKDGYAVVAVAQFLPDGKFSYCLEKGSKLSKLLGGK